MLEFSLTQHPFRLGLAEGVDPHQVPPGTLTRLENGVWRASGRIEKRFGTQLLPSTLVGGGTLSAGARLFTRGNELCLVDGASLYAYSSGYAQWKAVDTVPDLGVEWGPLLDTNRGVQTSDVAVSTGGTMVHAWVSGDPTSTASTGNLFLSVTDRATGAVLVVPTAITSAGDVNTARVVIVDGFAIVCFIRGGASTIAALTVNLSTLAVSAVTSLRTDVARIGWDICVIGSTFVLAYETTAAAPKLRLYSYNTSLVQQATGSISGEAGNTFFNISIAGEVGEPLYVAYFCSSATRVTLAMANSATLVQTVAPVTIDPNLASAQVTVCRYDASNCIIAWSPNPGGIIARTRSFQVSSTGTISPNNQRATWGTTIVGRPFMFGGKCYIPLADAPVNNAISTFTGVSTFLAEVETSNVGIATNVPHRYVGRIDGLVGGIPINSFHPTPSFVSSTEVVYPSFFHSQVPGTFAAWRQGVRLVKVTRAASKPNDLWRSVSIGQDLYFASGVFSAYDGALVFDYGFSRQPLFYTSSASTPAGAMAVGNYIYSFVLEYRCATGTLHRSPPSVPYTVATPGTPSQNAMTFVGTSLTLKEDYATNFSTLTVAPTILGIFRSVVGGTVPQRLSVEPTYNSVTNNATQQTLSLTDTRSDAAIDGSSLALATRAPIYTTGGILDDEQPPANVTCFFHADRIFALAGDRRTWWYTKSTQDDIGVAPGFSSDFRIVTEKEQVGGVSMDDKAVFFSTTGVAYMVGTGPAPDGTNSDFSPMLSVQVDGGCMSARSIVATPDGVMYQTTTGRLNLLTRGLEAVWIGRPVKDTLAAYPVVTSATLVPKHNQVRFTCNASDGLSGVVLVYDYVEKQWATSKYTHAGTYGAPIADACVHLGAWTFLTADGSVYREDETTHLDAGATWVPLKLETAWLSAAGPLAYHSVRSAETHGIGYTDHDLTISVGFDSDASYPQVATFLATTPAVAAGGTEDPGVTIGTRRKCQSIRFLIEDATPSAGTIGTGKGAGFDMLGLKVGIKRGFKAEPATKKR